jgi:phosphoribosylglycinamide formyltransferase-1
LTGPAQPRPAAQVNLKNDGLAVVGEALQDPSPDGLMAKGYKTLGQVLGIAKHGWQDGEMGHGAMPALADPSDHGGGVQWPLPQDWPSTRQPLRLGVMASGEGSNFEALAESCRRGWAEIVLLVVNNNQCGAHRRAARLGIPTTLIDHRHFPKREDLDRALIQAFQQKQVDLVAMAGWMRIVTPLLIQAYPGRLINIHPSLLPSFPGIDGVGQALAAGVTLSGCTAHLVSEEVDAGEILVQAAVPVLKTDDHASLSARIHRQEHNVLPLAVALAAQKLGL